MNPALQTILADKADYLLGFNTPKISKDKLHLPGPTFIDDVFSQSDRTPAVMRNMANMYNAGRLAGTGYTSILPVDQGLEHTAGYSFSKNVDMFDPAGIVELAIEGGCSAVASSLGVLGAVSRTYAHKIPFIVKMNHNESLSYPSQHDQVLFAQVEQAYNLGAVGVGATIYFGSDESRRQIQEISEVFAAAHELGMFTILWCYTRNQGYTKDGVNYERAADISAQANHIGVTLQADIIKQKLPETVDGMRQIGFGKYSDHMYDTLLSDHPIDMTRYQVANCYMGRAGLINSGGGSGHNDLQDAVMTAVINKRAGGMGLISGRKAFQKPMAEGVHLLHAIQDVYLDQDITVA